MSDPIFCGRLTRRALIALPEGAFLISEMIDECGRPVIAEAVPPAAQREAYWQKLQGSNMNGRPFFAFASAGASVSYYVAALNALLTPQLTGSRTFH